MTARPTILLLACVKDKAADACAARDLYRSTWFRKARAYAEGRGLPWYVLSAKYGLVSPTDHLDPYDETLNAMPATERRAWAARVLPQILALDPERVIILAGVKYREHLIPGLEARGVAVEVPMQGLGIGDQLHWLGAHAPRRATMPKDPARALAAHAREHGLEAVAEWLEDGRRRHLVSAQLRWPPRPSRGGAYSQAEGDRFASIVSRLPEVLALEQAARAWEAAMRQRGHAWWEHGGSGYRKDWGPSSQVYAWAEDWPRYRLGDAFRRTPKAERTPEWLARWWADARASLDDVRRFMASLGDEGWWDGSIPTEDVLRELTPWGGADVPFYMRQAGEVILRRRGIRHGDDVYRQRIPVAELERERDRRQAAERKEREQRRRERISAWAVLADTLDNLEADGGDAYTVEGLNTRFRQRRGRSTPEAIVRSRRSAHHGGRPVWLVQIRGLDTSGHSMAGPPTTRGEDDALGALHAFAKGIREWPREAAEGSVADFDARWGSLRRAVQEGYTSNPLRLWAPGLPDELIALASRAGLGHLAGFMEGHAPELAAGLCQVGRWSNLWDTGWRTSVMGGRGRGTVTRADAGRLPPADLLDVPGELRSATTRPDAPDGSAVAAAREAGTVPTVRIHRRADGAVVLVEDGEDAVALAHAAGLPAIDVEVMYYDGSEAHGLVADPAAGAWVLYSPGRRVKLRQAEGRRSGWTRDVVVGTTPDGWPVLQGAGPTSPRALRLLNEPVDVTAARARQPVTNPARRSRVDLGDDEVVVRRPAGRRLDGVRSALLRGATLTRGAHGDVVGVHGRLEATNRPPPPPIGGWAVVGSNGKGARYLADRATLGEDVDVTVYAVAGPAPRALANRARRAEGQQVVIDSEGRKYPAQYQVVEAAVDGDGELVVSHRPADLTQWTPGYPPSFQTRDLGSPPEQQKIRAIARDLDPIRVLAPNLDPTIGPPVVWEGTDGRLYALGGNGRTIAILVAPEPRYRAYVEMGRGMYPCWPTDPARPGHRWVLVRVVSGITEGEASQLGAASQLSSSAEEGRIGKALGLVRSLDLNLEGLPPIKWLHPIAADNVEAFNRENSAFIRAILDQMDRAKRAGFLHDTDRLAPLANAVLLGFLPADRRAGLFYDPKTEDALMGALPGMVTIAGAIHEGSMQPDWNLLPHLTAAVGVFNYLHDKGLSFKALGQELAIERRTVAIPGAARLSDTPPLALALAGALYKATRRTAPEDAAAGFMAGYYHEALKAGDPRQGGLGFGSSYAADPAVSLAALVPGMADVLQPPQQGGMFGNPAPVVRALRFDRRHFPAGSSARSWCKAHGYHAGVPRLASGGVFEIDQGRGAPPAATTTRPLAEGVVAVVDA